MLYYFFLKAPKYKLMSIFKKYKHNLQANIRNIQNMFYSDYLAKLKKTIDKLALTN